MHVYDLCVYFFFLKQLNKKKHNTPETCKYCGLRFVMKKGYYPAHH